MGKLAIFKYIQLILYKLEVQSPLPECTCRRVMDLDLPLFLFNSSTFFSFSSDVDLTQTCNILFILVEKRIVVCLCSQIATVKEVFRLQQDDELVQAEDKYLPQK